MKFTIQLFAIILSFLSFNSCNFLSGTEGSRNVTTEERRINEPFTGIKVSQGIDVVFSQNEAVILKAEMDDNLHALLITEVSDQVLKISFKENVRSRKASKIYLSAPLLKEISTSSGAGFGCVRKITSETMNLSSSSGSDIDIHIDASKIICDISSGSEIALTGICKELKVDASSGSDFKARNLICNSIEAEASSGSDIDIYATESINASSSSGGNIICEGNPKTKKLEKSSGGSIDIN